MCYYPECVHAGVWEHTAPPTAMGITCMTPDEKVIIFHKKMWSPEDCDHVSMIEDPDNDPELRKINEAAKEQGYVRRYLTKLGRYSWIKEEVAGWTDKQIIAHASIKPSWWETLSSWFK